MTRGAWCVVLMMLAGGCTTLTPASSKKEIVQGSPLGDCSVEMSSSITGAKKVALPVYENSTVQQVLEKSGAMRRFGRVQVDLARSLPDGNWHKMEVEYDRRNRRIASETDYQVRPGDRLLVKEDHRTILDDMVESSLGPMAATKRRR